MKKKSALSEAVIIGVRFLVGVCLLFYLFILIVVLMVVYAFRNESVNNNKHLSNVIKSLRKIGGLR